MWVKLINTGKTRAIDVTSKVAFISGAKSDEFAFNNIDSVPANINAKASVGILPPGQELQQRISPDTAYDELKVARIRNSVTLVHVIGRTKYKDIFGAVHQTDFCFRYAPEKPRMEICHSGNNAD
jgi:hypothetical protein